MSQQEPRKHGKFRHLAEESATRKGFVLQKNNGLGGNGHVPHDLWRRIVPIAKEFGKGNVDIALLYSYLVANVNGQKDNDRYMAAFKSVERIAAETGLGRNRISKLSDILEAAGLLKTVYDYTGMKRQKLYYPQYYTSLSNEQVRQNISKLYMKKAAE